MKKFFVLLLTLSAVSAFAEDLTNREFEVGNNPTLELSNISGEVTIEVGEVDLITVEAVIHDDRIDVIMEQDGDTVKVKTEYPKGRKGNFKGGVDFIVTFPPNGTLDISSVSGNVEASNIDGQLSLKTVSGTVRADGLRGDLELSTVSGSVILKNTNAQNISATSVSGSVRFESGALDGDSYTFSTTSGRVYLNVDGDDHFTLTGSTVSGSIRAEGFNVKKAKYGPQKSVNGAYGDGGAEVSVSVVSGGITIKEN